MIEVKLNQTYSAEDLRQLYKELKDTGYLTKWTMILTERGHIYQRFKTVKDYYEFIHLDDDNYTCSRTNQETIDLTKHDYQGIGIFSSDKRKSPAYWQEWYQGKKKFEWNPVTPIGGTDIKDYRKL